MPQVFLKGDQRVHGKQARITFILTEKDKSKNKVRNNEFAERCNLKMGTRKLWSRTVFQF